MGYLKRASEEFNWGLGNRLSDNWEEAAMKEEPGDPALQVHRQPRQLTSFPPPLGN